MAPPDPYDNEHFKKFEAALEKGKFSEAIKLFNENPTMLGKEGKTQALAKQHPYLDSCLRTEGKDSLACNNVLKHIIKHYTKTRKMNDGLVYNIVLVAIENRNFLGLEALKPYLKEHRIGDDNWRKDILTKAIETGNPNMVRQIKNLNILPTANESFDSLAYAAFQNGLGNCFEEIYPDRKINYSNLLDTAVEKNDVKTAMAILESSPTIPMGPDKLLPTAVKNGQFDMAVLLIINGADFTKLPTNVLYLEKFVQHLNQTPVNQTPVHQTTLQAIPFNKIQQRITSIERTLQEREGGKFYNFFTSLVKYVNACLPKSIQLSYNTQTETIKASLKLLKAQDPQKKAATTEQLNDAEEHHRPTS